MNTRKGKWILRSIQVLISLILLLIVVPAGAHLSGGYYHGGSWDSYNDNCLINNSPIDNSNWMAKIPDYRRLSELSIPETHDTMAIVGGALGQAQSLNLRTQLESGIRSLDIRLQRKYGILECWHGEEYLGAYFDDVLDEAVAFLEAHPTETILMRLAENSRPSFPASICPGICPIGDNPPFIQMVQEYLQRTYYQNSEPKGTYWDWVWQPTSVNPALDEVRGKIVILEHFSHVGEFVDVVGDVGMYTSLALDSAGKPHISYYDKTNGYLKYAFWTGEFWWFAPVDGGSGNDVGQYTSIALDDDDHPHISYYDVSSGNLKYAYGKNWIDYGQGWDWEISQIDDGSGTDVGKYTSLSLDKNDWPYISYYDVTREELRLANFVGNSNGNCVLNNNWNCTLIDGINDMGQFNSLALDQEDRPYISYYDATLGELRLANYVANSNGNCVLNNDWNCNVIDGGPGLDVGMYTSVALDAADNVHISYFDATYGDLKYATNVGGNWWYGLLDDGSGNDVGLYNSMALGDFDGRHISYYDATNSDLKYISYNKNSGMAIRVGETQGDVGQYTSIALDELENPHFSYYDANNADLMYAGLDSFCGDGISIMTQFGLKDKLPCFKEREYWGLCTRFDVIKAKWPRVKNQLIDADVGPRDKFYLNGLTGTVKDASCWADGCWYDNNCPYPWFVASGHVNSDTDAERRQTNEDCINGSPPNTYPDFPCSESGKMLWEGTNELTLNYLNAHPALLQPRRWGFIVMDFPGEDLIDAIVCSNFPSMNPLFIPAILK